jgi:hypothetical protein
MFQFTCLPKPVCHWLQVVRPMFRHRHHLIFCWLVVCQAIYQENATVTGLARLAPGPIAEWHLRRLLAAGYGNARLLVWWFADQVIATLPPPDDGVCYLVVDSTLNSKTGHKHPLAKQYRLNEYGPYVFGLHLVVVMRQWGNSRIPVACELVRRQDDPKYRAENALFRWMRVRFRRPSWAEMVVVVADAGFASQANIPLIQRRGFCCVMALARTWCFEHGHALKDLREAFAETARSPRLGPPRGARPPPDVLDLHQTRLLAAYRRCHHRVEPTTAPPWAKTAQNLGDQSARDERSPAGRRISPALVGGTAHEGMEGGDRVGPASSHQRSAAHRTVGSHRRHGVSATSEVSCPRYSGAGALERVHAQTKLHVAAGPSAGATFCRAAPAKKASGAHSRMIKPEYLSLSSKLVYNRRL